AAAQRLRADEARQREREAVVLYDVVRLMSEPDFDHALRAVAQRLHDELCLAAVSIKVTDNSGNTTQASFGEDDALQLACPRVGVPLQVMRRGPAPTEQKRGAPGRWVRIVPPYSQADRGTPGMERLQVVPAVVSEKRVGDLLLVRGAEAPRFTMADDRLLSAVATQLGIAVERVWLQREATEAEILRRTDELKTALLNAVSHDLRTPLASIIASAGSLRQHDVAWSEEERQEFAEAIEEEALRLNQIVGNLLDLSRMEGGTLKPEKGWYDLGALVDNVLGRLKALTSRHRIVANIPEDLPPVLLDYVEIDQVLSNLIENAIKYTAPGTEIQISARRDAGEVRVEVEDRGPGIPASALAHIFEPFYRASGQGPRPRGTGLGLAVAKGLVEAHGGRIWADNCPKGGSRFIFTLPLAESADASSSPRG
ncbi:MAG: ATP-binding protein, partial [Chloroflexi bacterium]|nr:ATP-binding protein [Chloroflexota bacterium]